MQSCTPRTLVRFGVHLNWQLRQIGERRVAKCRVMALASDTHLQNIGDFQSPQSRNPRAPVTQKLEDLSNFVSGFVAVHPSQSNGAVEDEAHRRPSSLSFLSVGQSNSPRPAFVLCRR